MRAVLVPFDFSPYAQRALRLALNGIPFGPEVQIEVLHVIDPALYERVLAHRPRPTVEVMQSHLHDAIAAARAESASLLAVEVSATVVEGDAFEQIVARAIHCGGVIVGGQGHGGIREKIIGRTASRFAEKINVPTYIVKSPQAHSIFATVLCAVDFSPGAKSVLRAGRELARAAGIDIVTVHAIPPLPPDLTAFDRKLLHENVEAAREKLVETERQTFGELQSTAQLCFVGASVRKIADVARLYDSSCIVVGRNSHPALGHAILGSVASRLLHASESDLLVVPLA